MYKITDEEIKIMAKYGINYKDYPDIHDLVDKLLAKYYDYVAEDGEETPEASEIMDVTDEITFNNPGKEFLEAIQEAEDIASGKIKVKGYHNVEQMFEDILSET